ncbi:PQQ-binding-like beta-propeller repeat protein [uncultured Jatrophihabitans sp.]|uniref:outer membrane protein assembly factor BamB family protein n=1 Tax=uncultured Jatrophihabitans sp. TaxID=1610747 RepID=UPI0035CB7C84
MTRLGGRGLALIIALFCFAFGLAAPAFAAAPTITSFTPTSGPLHTTVTITGTNFTSPATVKFNGVASYTVVVKSATTITAVTPPLVSTGKVSVTTSGGTATSSGVFTVTPGISSTPTVGPPGTAVNAQFSGFAAYEAVDVYVDATDLQLISATRTGTGHVTVTIPNSATPGTHYVTAVGRHSGYSAQAAFTVRTDWAQYGFDASHANTNPVEATLGAGNVRKLAQVWRSNVATQTNNYDQEAVVAGGIVYSVNDNGVVATSESTGAPVWSQVLGQVAATPAVSGSTLLFGTTAGHLIALNAATGAVKYNVTLSNGSLYLPITVVGSVAYTEVDTSDGTPGSIDAFDVTTGAQKWSYSISSYCFGASVSNGVLYTTCNNEHLYALNTSDGTLLFDDDATTYEHEGTPVVANGLVICAGFDTNNDTSVVLAYDAADGSLRWVQSTPLDLIPFTTFTVADDEVFVRAENDSASTYQIAAFQTADGTPLWTVPAATPQYFPMTAANGLLYVPSYTSTRVLDVETGSRVTTVSGGQFATITDAGLIDAVNGTALMRFALPTSAYPTVQRPTAATLHPNHTLRTTA